MTTIFEIQNPDLGHCKTKEKYCMCITCLLHNVSCRWQYVCNQCDEGIDAQYPNKNITVCSGYEKNPQRKPSCLQY